MSVFRLHITMNFRRYLEITAILILVARRCYAGHKPGEVTGNEFNVGVILPFTGGWEIGGWIASAVDIAIVKINELQILPGYSISYVVKDSQCNSKIGMEVALDIYENTDDIDAYVGGGCSEVCKHVSLLASAWNLPLVSFGCNSNELSNIFDYPTFSRTVGVWTTLASMVDAICDFYGWERVGILATSESILQLTKVAIEDYLTQKAKVKKKVFHQTIKTTYTSQIVPERLREATMVLKEMSKQTKVFILLLYNKDIRNILMAAWDNGMISKEYAYITIELDMKIRDWPERKDELFLATNGIFSINMRKPTGPEWNDFSQKVIIGLHKPLFNTWQNLILPLDSPPEKVPVYAGTLHDAMLLWARGVNKSMDAGYGPDDGRNITQQMFNMDVEGILGRIRIDEKGDRMSDYTFSILQTDGFHDLLLWSSFHETLTATMATNINYMVNSTDPPSGRPKCGWESEFCKSVLPYALPSGLIGGLILFVVIVVLLYRHMKYQAELKAVLLWKVEWVEIEHRRLGELKLKEKATFKATKTYNELYKDLQPQHLEMADFKGLTVVIKRFDKKSIDMKDREILLELKDAVGLKHENLNKFIGAVTEAPQVSLLIQHSERGSLQDVIQHEGINLTWDYKLSFAYDLAKGMEYIHGSPLIYHGHLTSANILVDGLWACRITDYGMHNFKKGAKNINRKHPSFLMWTAPEILRTSGRQGTQKGDVYSYGIIVQEIVLKDGPYCFNELTFGDIVEKVKMGLQFRPSVPGEACSREWRNLMEDCWSEYQNFRPTFTVIRKMLREVNGGNPISGVKNMVRLLEQHTDHLEKLLIERSEELTEEEGKVEALLMNMLPKPVAQSLIKGVEVTPETYEAVTIYFSDIVGFANVTANYRASQVVETLNDIYIKAEEIIQKYNVFKVEVVGDAHMIASGLPEKCEDHAEQICSMALHLLSAITCFRFSPETNRPEFHLRIGIHSGPCVAGVVGTRLPRYLLFGETVILASRMQSKSRSLRILISDDTAAQLQDAGGYQLQSRGEIQVKENRFKRAFWLQGKENFEHPLPNFNE